LLKHYIDMPARAQNLSSETGEDVIDFNLCQCECCGLIQLDCTPPDYWLDDIQTASRDMQERRERMVKESGATFTSFCFLEHTPRPNDYLTALLDKVEAGERGIIEVPNFDMIADNGLFHEIMRDHLCYFTADTLRFALEYNGFGVESIMPSFGDYLLTAMVYKRPMFDVSVFNDAQQSLKAELDEFCKEYSPVGIYGASHEALAIIALCKPGVAIVIDDSELKQGKYTPARNVPIVPGYGELYCKGIIVIGAGYSDIILRNLDHEGAVAVVRGSRLEVIHE